MENSWEQGEVGTIGFVEEECTSPGKGPTCKRGVLLEEDQSSYQKSWGHLKEKWMSLLSCFPRAFQWAWKGRLNSCYHEVLWANIAVIDVKHRTEQKKNKPQSWCQRTDRQTKSKNKNTVEHGLAASFSKSTPDPPSPSADAKTPYTHCRGWCRGMREKKG